MSITTPLNNYYTNTGYFKLSESIERSEHILNEKRTLDNFTPSLSTSTQHYLHMAKRSIPWFAISCFAAYAFARNDFFNFSFELAKPRYMGNLINSKSNSLVAQNTTIAWNRLVYNLNPLKNLHPLLPNLFSYLYNLNFPKPSKNYPVSIFPSNQQSVKKVKLQLSQNQRLEFFPLFLTYLQSPLRNFSQQEATASTDIIHNDCSQSTSTNTSYFTNQSRTNLLNDERIHTASSSYIEAFATFFNDYGSALLFHGSWISASALLAYYTNPLISIPSVLLSIYYGNKNKKIVSVATQTIQEMNKWDDLIPSKYQQQFLKAFNLLPNDERVQDRFVSSFFEALKYTYHQSNSCANLLDSNAATTWLDVKIKVFEIATQAINLQGYQWQQLSDAYHENNGVYLEEFGVKYSQPGILNLASENLDTSFSALES